MADDVLQASVALTATKWDVSNSKWVAKRQRSWHENKRVPDTDACSMACGVRLLHHFARTRGIDTTKRVATREKELVSELVARAVASDVFRVAARLLEGAVPVGGGAIEAHWSTAPWIPRNRKLVVVLNEADQRRALAAHGGETIDADACAILQGRQPEGTEEAEAPGRAQDPRSSPDTDRRRGVRALAGPSCRCLDCPRPTWRGGPGVRGLSLQANGGGTHSKIQQ